MKARLFYSEFWEPNDLSANARYLHVYYITNEKNTLTGIYKISDRTVAFQTNLSVEEVKLAKAELVEEKKLAVYKSWVYVPHAQRLGGFYGTKFDPAVEKELERTPTDVIEYFTGLGYEIPYRWAIHSHRVTNNSINNSNNSKVDNLTIDDKELDELFKN